MRRQEPTGFAVPGTGDEGTPTVSASWRKIDGAQNVGGRVDRAILTKVAPSRLAVRGLLRLNHANSETRRTKTVPERDGSTPAHAIVEDQNAWRRRNCPGFTRIRQMLLHIDGKFFDQVTFRSEAEVRVVYFDISQPFLKGLRLAQRRLARHQFRHRRRCALALKRTRAWVRRLLLPYRRTSETT